MADLSMMDDRVLWNRATQARCEEAFRTLMSRHEMLVWNVCSRLLRNRSDAEDAFQMAFIAMLEHGDDIKSSDFRPWLYRVAYRAALRVQGARVDVDSLTDANAVPEDSVDTEVFRSIEQAEQSQLIEEALDSLPEKYREVLVLHYCCGVARDDIASQLGLTPQTVKARLSRARKALRSRLLRRGLSLGLAAVFLGTSAEAAVSNEVRNATWQLAERWLTGEPVGLDLAQFSDFPQTEYGMKSLGGLNAKWTLVGAVALLALFFVFEAGRASGAPGVSTAPGVASGTNRLPASGTRVAIEEENAAEEIIPAAHFVAKPPVSGSVAQDAVPAATRPTVANTQSVQPVPRTNTAPAVVNSQMVSATQVQQSKPGLPDGTWKRDSMFGEVSFLVDGNRLQVDFQGKGELAVIRGSLLGEYSVASDGTIFGLFHGADLDLPAEAIESGAADFGMLMNMMSDSPFAMRVHTSGNTMVVKKFTLGVALPAIDGIEEYAGVGSTVNMYVVGGYRSDQQPQRVGNLPARVHASPVSPRRMQQMYYPQYPQANLVPAMSPTQTYPNGTLYYPAGTQPYPFGPPQFPAAVPPAKSAPASGQTFPGVVPNTAPDSPQSKPSA